MTSPQRPDPHHIPLGFDPRRALPGEVPAQRRARFIQIAWAIGLLGTGIFIGLALTPESPKETQARIASLEKHLAEAQQRAIELDRSLRYKTGKPATVAGQLKPADRKRHEQTMKQYTKLLRQVRAQGASELMTWFIGRWNSALDHPDIDDRIRRRADLLSRLIGGMAENLNPQDYVPWQAEFLNADWLGELHFDLDGDGYPTSRTGPNPHDAFADVSVCQIAMALNQTIRDARVLVTPELVCDRPEAKMSVFLHGATLDDALTAFVDALKRLHFVVVEAVEKNIRLVLIAPPQKSED